MSGATNEINKVTSTIIGVAGKLIIYALVILLMYEGVTRGYQFGYDIFYPTSVAQAPGVDMKVSISEESVWEIGKALKSGGLIESEYTFWVQSFFYEYGGDFKVIPGTYILNNSMTPKEIIIILREGPKEEEAAQ